MLARALAPKEPGRAYCVPAWRDTLVFMAVHSQKPNASLPAFGCGVTLPAGRGYVATCQRRRNSALAGRPSHGRQAAGWLNMSELLAHEAPKVRELAALVLDRWRPDSFLIEACP